MIILSRLKCLSRTVEGRSSLTSPPLRSDLENQMQRLWWVHTKIPWSRHYCNRDITLSGAWAWANCDWDLHRWEATSPSWALPCIWVNTSVIIIIHCIVTLSLLAFAIEIMVADAGQRATAMVLFLQTPRSPLRLRSSGSETRSRLVSMTAFSISYISLWWKYEVHLNWILPAIQESDIGLGFLERLAEGTARLPNGRR